MDNKAKIYIMDVAGILIKITLGRTEKSISLKQRFAELIEQSYKNFLVTRDVKKINYQIKVEEKKRLEVFEKLIGNSSVWFMNYFRQNSSNKVTTYYHISFVQLQYIIKRLLQEGITREGGFILHASAVLVKNQVVCFVGRPGAGKSTAMLLLSKSYPVLADDSIIVRKLDRKLVICQTPFIESNWVPRGRGKYLLKLVLFLKKTKSFKVEKISDKEYILSRIIKQLMTEESLLKYQMKTILEFAEKTEFGMLHFAKDENKLKQLFETI